jgi:hypothetical protein
LGKSKFYFLQTEWPRPVPVILSRGKSLAIFNGTELGLVFGMSSAERMTLEGLRDNIDWRCNVFKMVVFKSNG